MKTLLIVLALLCGTQSLDAQWRNVFQLPNTRGCSAYFLNATEGVIGAGDYHYRHGLIAKIFYTDDGGNTWRESRLPNTQIVGQVTDIYFTDRTNGWATIVEGTVRGWSGVYHSTDAGHSWKYILPAANPCGVRETKRGVFVTNGAAKQGDPSGILFSSDHGATWSMVGMTLVPLGIDFLNGATGYATAHGAAQENYLTTVDSGKTWTSLDVGSEAWSVFADPVTTNFFIASEGDGTTITSILRTASTTATPAKIQTYSNTGLSGGVGGNHGCQSVVYVQGRSPLSTGPHGFIRTMDGGLNWKSIQGPMNTIDTRFAVTGRGAVVYAFDSVNGVWKTDGGGDTTLSPSALKFVTIQKPLGTLAAHRCDSAYATFQFNYRACDSSRVSRVAFVNDSLGELSAPHYSNDFGFFSLAQSESLKILYQPSLERSWRVNIRLTIQQPDGYEEDTIVTLDLNGLASLVRNVTFLDTTSPKVLDFGPVSICSGDERGVTLANQGCSDILIDNLTIGAPFSLVSTFRPFTLSAGSKRAFLLGYAPASALPDNGLLIVQHNGVSDSLKIIGTGIAPSLALEIVKPDTVSSTLCDTAAFEIHVRNEACKAFKVISVTADTPFTTSAFSQVDSIHTGETTTLHFRFAPNVQGPATRSITLKVAYEGAQEYDTTVSIVGVGTGGLPELAVNGDASTSAFTFDIGSVSFCSDALDTVLFLSKGCGLSEITNAIFETGSSTFTIERSPVQIVSHDLPDTMIVRYHPRQTGPDIGTVLLNTTVGVRTIEFKVNVTSDPGSIQIASTQAVSALTCDSAAFNISITNGTCDSLTIVTAKVTGANPSDFLLRTSVPVGLGTRAQKDLAGIFQPQDSLARTATAVLTIQRADGSTFDTTVTLMATGIAVPVIPVQLLNVGFTARAFGNYESYPLMVFSKQGSGSAKVGAIDFTLVLNTDLITPLSISDVPADFVFNQGTVTLTHDSAIFHCALSQDVAIKPNQMLCQINCGIFVTDTFNTPVALIHPRFSSVNGATSCLKTLNLDHDSGFTFTLKYECNDSTLKDFIKYQRVLIDRISPNPTSGEMTMRLDIPGGYREVATLEVYDALGARLSVMPLYLDGSAKQTISLDLSSGAAGMRYLVLRTAHGVATANVMLQK